MVVTVAVKVAEKEAGGKDKVVAETAVMKVDAREEAVAAQRVAAAMVEEETAGE